MDLHGNIEVFDWTDQATGLTIRVAQYDPILTAKLYALHSAAAGSPAMRQVVDGFNRKVLGMMQLDLETRAEEAPLYYWVRAMKVKNRLSFEDGEYHIPDPLASCIVRCPGAKHFVQMLG
jgi:hypothetical protein